MMAQQKRRQSRLGITSYSETAKLRVRTTPLLEHHHQGLVGGKAVGKPRKPLRKTFHPRCRPGHPSLSVSTTKRDSMIPPPYMRSPLQLSFLLSKSPPLRP